MTKCEKCKKHFEENVWEKGKTYKAIDFHHNPPMFMIEKWKGEIIPLCRKCHRELHDKIIESMFKHSNLFKPKKSEYWTWLAIFPSKREEVLNEIVRFTKEWLGDDTNT